MAFFELATRELFGDKIPASLLRDSVSLPCARSSGAAAPKKRGSWFLWRANDHPRINDPVFSSPSGRLAQAVLSGAVALAAAERAAGTPSAGVFHAGEPLLSIAARHSLPMLQAIWHSRGIWDKNEFGATPWMAALSQATPETVAWLGSQMETAGAWMDQKPVHRANNNLSPLFFLARSSSERFPVEALRWIKDEEFWSLDASGASALEHALDSFSPSKAAKADALLAEAFSRPKNTPKARAGWRRWMRVAIDEHLDAGLQWPLLTAAMESRILRAQLPAPLPGDLTAPRARTPRI